MAGALNAVVVAVAVAVAPLLLVGMARADCFDYCFKNCIAKDKSMTDYCNYACDKTCDPGAPQRHLAAAAAGTDIGCELACARTSCNRLGPAYCLQDHFCPVQYIDAIGRGRGNPDQWACRFGIKNDCKSVETCFGRCYDGCKTKPLPRPLRVGATASVSSASIASGPIFPPPESDPHDTATEKHLFHEKQDGVRPSSEAPDPDGSGHPIKASSSLNCNFRMKQDGVQPASEQQRTPLSEIHAAPPGPL